MSGSTTLPLIMTAAGPQPTPVTTIYNDILTQAGSLAPGLTALPASLVNDMAGTATGAAVQADQARVDAVASVSPLAANPYILALLGQQFGIPQGLPTNTSVDVIFAATSGGQPAGGLVIPAGFLVSDGQYQYATRGAVTTASTGETQQVAAVATQAGSWAVAAGAVTTIVTSSPPGFTLTVTNPGPGIAGTAAQSVQSYRAQIMEAQNVTVTGTGAFVATALANVTGVLPNLVRVVQETGGLKVICGLTVDQNLIAGAIYGSVPDVSMLQASVMTVTDVTQANPGVVTTGLNHGYAAGQVVTFSGIVGMTELNTGRYAVASPTEDTFALSLAPPLAPTLTANTTGGSLPTETVYVKVTLVSSDGETTPSPEVSVAITGSTGQVVVTSPPTQTGATGYNVYAANATGAEVLQNGGTPVSIGTNYDINSLTTGTAAPPSANTAALNTSSFTAYGSGGVVSPNLRNITTSITDGQNVFSVVFVAPPAQVVTGTVTWATDLPSFSGSVQVAALGAPALVAYVNGLYVGQPINLLEMTADFQTAVASVLPPGHLTALTFSIDINGVTTAPDAGTSIIPGDPESYFTAAPNAFTIS